MIVAIIVAIIGASLAIAHFSGCGYEQQIPPEEPTAYVVEMPTQETTTAEETWDEPYVHHLRPYTVNGAYMPYDWQVYLYSCLENYGISWFYGYAIAQIYGESRFDPYAQNPNGLDKGLCQIREPYWAGWAAQAGVAGASIYDAYAQIRVYAMLISAYLKAADYDIGRTLSWYYLGTNGYAADYVDYIMGLYSTIRVGE